MTKTRFTLSEASRITGKSRTTLRTYLRKGKLSYVQGHGDQRLLEASELTRVFGEGLDFGLSEPTGKRATATKPAKASGQSGLDNLELVQQQLEREISERRRERDHFEKQLDELHEVLKRTQDGHAKAMLLLENRAGQKDDWQASLRSLEKRIANQEREQREAKDAAKKRITQLRKELEAERSRPFFARLFGVSG